MVRSALLMAALALAACTDSPPAERTGAPAQAEPSAAGAPESQDTIDLGSLGYEIGSPDAPVAVVEFSDFGCPYCAQHALTTLPELKREFVESGQVRYRYVPFVLGTFPNAAEAALAAECAAEQDRFWAMHDLLYERQREWKGTGQPGRLFPAYAAEVGLDADRFAACFTGEGSAAERAALNTRVAERIGIRSTPTFLINGRAVQGALPLDQFRMMLQWSGAGAGGASTP